MDLERIVAGLKRFFETEFPNPAEGELTPTTNLLEDWFIDSFGIVTTVMHLEKEYGISVQRADINADNFHDIESLAAYVAGKLGKR